MKVFWDFEPTENVEKLKITRECINICKSIFKSRPQFLHALGAASTQKYRDLNFNGIEEGYEIFERFLIKKNDSVVLVGAIILPECSYNTDQMKKPKPQFRELDDQYEAVFLPDFRKKTDQQMVYGLNFYKLNDKEEAKIFMQFQLYEREGTNMIVRGSHDDMLGFIVEYGLQTKNQVVTVERWLGPNFNKLQVVFECVLILAECFFFLVEKCYI